MKVTGPGLSITASGKLAGVLVASTWKGRPYMRQLVTPANPKSGGQVGTRAMMAFLGANWANLTVNEQATWESLGEDIKASSFNAFVKYNMNRWTQFTAPKVDPAQAAGTVPVMGALTATPGVRQISLSQAVTTLNGIWGMIICMSTTTGFTPGRTNCVGVQYGVTSPIARVLTPVAAGTWYIRTAGFNRGATLSAFIAEVTAVVA